MTEDPHTPTSAGPTPERPEGGEGSIRSDQVASGRPTPPDPTTQEVAAEAGATAPQPTPTVPASDASWSRPPGTAAAEGASEMPMADRPEVLVGAAFAGGLVAAKILKRLGR
jgi:hypothetical protein